ncbi:MAG: hypothetical protein ACOYT4_02450 [Nanoarchaeota archaeon]
MKNLLENINEWNKKYNYNIRIFGDNPEFAILGENHANQAIVEAQIELIKMLKSRAVLHEFARNYIFDLKGKRIYENQDYITPEKVKLWANKKSKDFEVIDISNGNFKEWIEKNKIKNELNSYELVYEELDFEGNLGEILNKPKLLRNLERIIGCDYSYAESHFYEEQNGIEFSSNKCSRKHHAFREARFAEVIFSYNNKVDLAIIGACHIREKSYIHEELAKKQMSYICINQFLIEG